MTISHYIDGILPLAVNLNVMLRTESLKTSLECILEFGAWIMALEWDDENSYPFVRSPFGCSQQDQTAFRRSFHVLPCNNVQQKEFIRSELSSGVPAHDYRFAAVKVGVDEFLKHDVACHLDPVSVLMYESANPADRSANTKATKVGAVKRIW